MTEATHSYAEGSGNGRRPAWHYTPALPLGVSPCFRWPPNPFAILKWLSRGWLPLFERLIILLPALLSWARFAPPAAPVLPGLPNPPRVPPRR